MLTGTRAVLVNIVEECGAPESGARAAAGAGLFAELGASEAIIAPLAARGRIIGVITLAVDRDDHHVTDSDLDLAEDVARRAALALDNARLHAGQRDVAEKLQRSLLTTLPNVHHLSLAARHLPAGRHNRVGGD